MNNSLRMANVASTKHNSSIVISIVSLSVSVIVFGLAIYMLVQLHRTQRALDNLQVENRGRIGRLVKEINLINDKKRVIDMEQNEKLDMWERE